MPDPAIAITFTGNDADAARMFARQQKEIDGLKGSLRGIKAAGQEAGTGIATGFAEAAAAYGAAKVGIDMVAQSIAAMGRRSEETADKTQGLIRDITVFAALQSAKPIAAPTQQMLDLGMSMGVAKGDLGKLMTLAASVQRGVGGDAKAALRETGELLMVHQLGMPLEELREITDRAKALRGADIGETAREVEVLGRKMHVDPALIGKAMTSFELFKTPEEGFAMAATLGARMDTRRARAAMETVEETFGVKPPEAMLSKLKRAGVRPDAGIMANLEAVRAAGIVEPEDFQKRLGVADVGKALALSIAVKERANMRKLAAELPEMAGEAVIAREVGEIEAQMPEVKAARLLRTAETQAFLGQTTGAGGVQAMMDQTERFERGTAARRRGRAGGPVREGWEERGIDESGRQTYWRGLWQSFMESDFFRVGVPMPRDSELGPQTTAPLTRKFDAAVDKFSDGISKMRGGAAMVPAGEDR